MQLSQWPVSCQICSLESQLILDSLQRRSRKKPGICLLFVNYTFMEKVRFMLSSESSYAVSFYVFFSCQIGVWSRVCNIGEKQVKRETVTDMCPLYLYLYGSMCGYSGCKCFLTRRRLAEALQIDQSVDPFNKSTSSKYSDSLKEDARFCKHILLSFSMSYKNATRKQS